MPDTISYSCLLGITDELLNSKDNVKLFVGGNSMYPHLRKGDYVTVKKEKFSKLKQGDVIVFKGAYKYVAHRVIKIITIKNQTLIIPKGDSLKKKDTPLTEDKYLGKIISYERNGRETNLESPFYKRYNAFLAVISPYTPFIYSLLRFFKHLFRKKK